METMKTCDRLDCAGMSKTYLGKCAALNPYARFKGECPFYKSNGQSEEEQKKTVERLTRIGCKHLLERYE